MFGRGPAGELPFWSYRRIFDADLLADPVQTADISMINWASNDYRFANIIDKSAEEVSRVLDEAKRLSLGFLYWLQTECPRGDGGYGYPEIKLRPDILDTLDGLSKAPYIRESRRIIGLERITETEITLKGNHVRARHCANSVGVGWYQMDLHPSVGNDTVTMYTPTLPFQIPLGALIPVKTKNLLAACKNIATTHLTNGAYRLHPVEWATGEAAGRLAAYCVKQDKMPAQVYQSEQEVKKLQDDLLQQGMPLVWAVDVPVTDNAFTSVQRSLLDNSMSRVQAERLPLNVRLEDDLLA